MPAVISLGLAISIISVFALQIMAQNSTILNGQYYTVIAREAAQSGVAAAVKCINNSTIDWGTGSNPNLTPQTDCHGATVSGRPTTVANDTSDGITTTYSVSALQNPYNNTSRVIQSTGTTRITDSLGRNITLATKTVRSFGHMSAAIPTAVTSLNANYGTSCAVANGAGYCWGYNGNGQFGNGTVDGPGLNNADSFTPVAVSTSGVLSGKTMTAISAGYDYTCAIANGAPYCWGYNGNGQLGNGTTTENHLPVATTTSGVLAGKTMTAISSSDNIFVCGIASGAAYCWGGNSNGQLGNNSTTQSNVPVAVTTSGVLSGKTVTAISVGYYHTCAVASGQAYCWGNNNYGQLGNNSTTQSLVPVAVTNTGVLAGKTVTAIAAGQWNTCAVASGQVYCWGWNGNGQLGNNSTTTSLVPVAVTNTGVLAGKTATAVTTNYMNSCAVASSQAYCWGYNGDGELGNGTGTNSLVPVAVDTSGVLNGQALTDISTSEYGGICATADANSYCWGFNGNGNLGNGTTTDGFVPVATQSIGIFGGPAVTDVSSNTSDSCGIANGAAYCWGDNTYGQLGNNSTTASSTPVAVDTSGVLAGKIVTAIAVGTDHTCAIASGQAYCWGANTAGGLGNNSTTQSLVPVAVYTSGVLSGLTVTGITAGSQDTCAIANGAAYCWGLNTSSQLGNNSATSSTVPVAVYASGVLSGKTVTAISTLNNHTCVIASGVADCWGDNTYGELGNNSTTATKIPVAVYVSGVLSGKLLSNITAGDGFSCAVASGVAYCWGINAFGQLGNNSTTQSKIPVAVTATGVLSGQVVTNISAGGFHTCAVANGAAYCWGSSSNGQVGANSTNTSSVPVAVTTTGGLNGKALTSTAAGWYHTCSVANGQAYCWGQGGSGQLGNSTINDSYVPLGVSTISGYPSIYTINGSESF